jgi:uncharacterized protein with HEPN domain
MKRSKEFLIKDIAEYSALIQDYTENISFEQFINDSKTCNAVIRCIEVIGEATKNIPDELKVKYTSIPWKNIAGMRDIAIHDYSDLDYEEVWQVAKKDIPDLVNKISDLAKKEGINIKEQKQEISSPDDLVRKNTFTDFLNNKNNNTKKFGR